MLTTQWLEAIFELAGAGRAHVEAIATALDAAARLLADGRSTEAEARYRAILASKPGEAAAWHGLAKTLLARHDLLDARSAIDHALDLEPLAAEHHFLLGTILLEQDGPAAPAELHPRPGASILEEVRLGNSCMVAHDIPGARDAYTRALAQDPSNVLTLKNLDVAHTLLGRRPEALTYRGLARYREGRYSEAVEDLEESLAGAQSSQPYETALALGGSFKQLRRLPEAAHGFRQALALRQTDSLNRQLVDVLARDGLLDDAAAVSVAASERFPQDLYLKHFPSIALPAIYDSTDELEEHRLRVIAGLDDLCEATPLNSMADTKAALRFVEQWTNFYLPYQGHDVRTTQVKYGQFMRRVMVANYPQWAELDSHGSRRRSGRIRIGYASAYFRFHAVARLMLGWLTARTQSEFEVFCYHFGESADAVSGQFRFHSDHYCHVPGDFDALCTRIRDDRLDVLVLPDVGMDPVSAMLAALRLAPNQCVSWGHPVTSGSPTIDFFISGDLIEPTDGAQHYSEQLIRLPNIGTAYVPSAAPSRVTTRGDLGIPKGRVAYLCCQSLYKYLPQHDHLFAEIACGVPDAAFILAGGGLAPNVIRRFRDRLAPAFQRYGLDCDDYCFFVPELDHLGFLALYRIADVYLDSLGWSGGNTTLDAVALGLPVVTLPGAFMRGRYSYGVLTMMGMPHTIATSESDYVSIAQRLGRDPQWRREISQMTLAHHPRLFNDVTCVRGLETFYQQAVAGSVRG